MNNDELFMKDALKEAKKAYEKEEVPVGAVIVKDGKIIARGHNLKETKVDTIKHAEIIAIKKAEKKLNSSRIKKVYVGTMDEKTGACGSVLNLFEYNFNHKVELETGILKEECKKIIQKFFKELRIKKKGKLDEKK